MKLNEWEYRLERTVRDGFLTFPFYYKQTE